jgi:hypothetical protein
LEEVVGLGEWSGWEVGLGCDGGNEYLLKVVRECVYVCVSRGPSPCTRKLDPGGANRDRSHSVRAS